MSELTYITIMVIGLIVSWILIIFQRIAIGQYYKKQIELNKHIEYQDGVIRKSISAYEKLKEKPLTMPASIDSQPEPPDIEKMFCTCGEPIYVVKDFGTEFYKDGVNKGMQFYHFKNYSPFATQRHCRNCKTEIKYSELLPF